MENNQLNPQTPPTASKKPITKKWWFWVIVVIAVISIIKGTAGNDKPKKETPQKTSATSETSSSKDVTFSLNETAVFETIKVTANKIEQSSGKNFFQPESGNVFVGVQFTVENISDEDQNISSLLLFDAYVDGVKCDYSFTANSAFSDGTLDGELTPGKKMIGYYSVELPKNWSELELQVKSEWLSNTKAAFVFHQ